MPEKIIASNKSTTFFNLNGRCILFFSDKNHEWEFIISYPKNNISLNQTAMFINNFATEYQ